MSKKHNFCPGCGEACYGKQCMKCRGSGGSGNKIERVLQEETNVAPTLPTKPKLHGDFVIISDPHIPFHSVPALSKACEAAQLMGITRLVIAGDLLQADMISKYVNAGKRVKITDELAATGRVLHVLSDLFDEIHVIMGNHDQRLERMAAKWKSSREGREAFEMLARVLDVQDDAESLAYGILETFLANDKVKLYPLPELTINGEWIVMHPGSCSRVSPQTERRMIHKFRKSVIGGHNHLFGVGFDDSGEDIALNIGHCSDPSKMRYIHEKITTFPSMNLGFCVIFCDEDHPHGQAVPIAVHDKWFDLASLAKRLGDNVETV